MLALGDRLRRVERVKKFIVSVKVAALGFLLGLIQIPAFLERALGALFQRELSLWTRLVSVGSLGLGGLLLVLQAGCLRGMFEIYGNMGAELPVPTRILMSGPWAGSAGALGLMISLVALAARSTPSQRRARAIWGSSIAMAAMMAFTIWAARLPFVAIGCTG